MVGRDREAPDRCRPSDQQGKRPGELAAGGMVVQDRTRSRIVLLLDMGDL